MKKPNRRSKPANHSAPDSSPPAKDGDLKRQQHREKRVRDLENENQALKREMEALKCKTGSGSSTSVDGSQNMKQDGNQKLHALEEQVVELKRKLSAYFQLSTQKQKTGETGRLLQDEVQKLKVQKVELLCKMKLQSVQFRQSKASLEKEILQLNKDQRWKKYEMHKLLALNQRQKLVLQRKSEEASMASKRLTELLKARKTSSQRTSGPKADQVPGIQGIEIELKVAQQAEEIRAEYERQMAEMADEVRKYEEEAEMLRQENFRYLLQDKEVDRTVRESELSDLKEEVALLSKLVSQLKMPKAQVYAKNSQAYPVTSSASIGSSIDSLDMGTSESDNFGTSSEADLTGDVNVVENPLPDACCSCSKRSLCKTMKCECRAAESCCRTSCGCAASKCTNREVVLTRADVSSQSVVALESGRCSGTKGMEKDAQASQSADLNNDSAPRRKPLHEIEEAVINSSPIKPGQLLWGQKPVSQADHLDQFLPPEHTADAKGEGKFVLADVPVKLTRGKRVSNLR